MRFTVAVVIGLLIGFLPGLGVARAGETATDVTVRRWPAAAAPAVRDLPAGVAVTARGHWRGWVSIAGPARGWIPVASYSPTSSAASGAKAASADRPVEEPDSAPGPAAALAASGERSEGDLMFEAINATRGETPNAARIARVLADAKDEVKRNEESNRRRKSAVMALYWKDPFADDPDRPIPVAPRRRASEIASARRLAARARAETAGVRAEAAAARADAARAKAEAARVEATAARADAMAAKHDAAMARAGCADPTASSPRTVTLARGVVPRERPAASGAPAPERDWQRVVRTPTRRAQAQKVAMARAARGERAAEPSSQQPPAEEPAPPPPPANIRSTDPRGIVIVPINTAPAASTAGGATVR